MINSIRFVGKPSLIFLAIISLAACVQTPPPEATTTAQSEAAPASVPAATAGQTPKPAETVAPTAVAVEAPSVDVDAIASGVKQYADEHLPAGVVISEFKLDEAPQNDVAAAQNTARGISMKGEANSNKDVSDLLRAMSMNPELENVELVSIERTANDKMGFLIRLKIKAR